ncbi:amidase family protein [Burkholderia gladioli]|uniref:amidase family protein n=1 Tax=Burkholderia gladioli TaxID=28095 RepID=UPI003A4DFCD6
MSAAADARASRRLYAAARVIGAFFENHDVLLTSTLAQLPVEIGALAPSALERRLVNMLGVADAGWVLKRLGMVRRFAVAAFEFMPWTPVFNVTGQPAMSVPLHWDSSTGLPIGMHFAARFGEEAVLFSLAAQLERAKPWLHRMPVV